MVNTIWQYCIYSEGISYFGLHSFLVTSQNAISSKRNEEEKNKHLRMKTPVL